MSKEGITYVDVELVCLKFDEFLKNEIEAGRPQEKKKEAGSS